jgi:hydroxyethylthiazole kinase-like uncharacterized protein yjeF
VMSVPLKETKDVSLSLKAYAVISAFIKKIDVIACGCGASRNNSTLKLLQKIIQKVDKPMVIDADGINALAERIEVLKKRRTRQLILTPHEGEFARLIKKDAVSIRKKRKELAKEFALRYNLVLALKGNKTVVTDGRRLYQNNTGSPGMATAGSGDVLTGMIAGLLAQKLDCFDAARVGVYLHGLAGDYAVKELTQMCVTASDIIKYLSQAVKVSRRSSIGRAGVL